MELPIFLRIVMSELSLQSLLLLTFFGLSPAASIMHHYRKASTELSVFLCLPFVVKLNMMALHFNLSLLIHMEGVVSYHLFLP